jgi:hypothetical protein
MAVAFQRCFRICCLEGVSNQNDLKLNGTYQLLFYAYAVNIFVGHILSTKKTESLVVASNEIGLE